jgi:hypothetical protein
MLSNARKLLSRSIVGSSLAGDGLLVRLRSTSIALLGVVTAVGLGLIAFISQLGWPGVLNAPIPGPPTEAGTVHGAIALTQPKESGGQVAPAVAAGTPARGTRVPPEPPQSSGIAGSVVGDSHQLSGSGAAAQPPAPGANTPPAPTSTPTPEPESSPVTATATPTPAAPTPVASSPVSTPPKTSVVSPVPAEPSPEKSDQDEPGKPNGGDHGNSNEDKHGAGSGKSQEPPVEPTKPSSAVKPPAPQVVSPSPPKGPPESAGHSAGGPSKSDWHRH